MIEDNRDFFAAHPDPEVRRRGGFLIEVISGLRASNMSSERLAIAIRAQLRPARQATIDALQASNWELKAAAARLSISLCALRGRMTRFQISSFQWKFLQEEGKVSTG